MVAACVRVCARDETARRVASHHMNACTLLLTPLAKSRFAAVGATLNGEMNWKGSARVEETQTQRIGRVSREAWRINNVCVCAGETRPNNTVIPVLAAEARGRRGRSASLSVLLQSRLFWAHYLKKLIPVERRRGSSTTKQTFYEKNIMN